MKPGPFTITLMSSPLQESKSANYMQQYFRERGECYRISIFFSLKFKRFFI
jgi:hypothetical protein